MHFYFLIFNIWNLFLNKKSEKECVNDKFKLMDIEKFLRGLMCTKLVPKPHNLLKK